MKFLVYGTEGLLVNNQIDKIVKEKQASDSFEIVKFDLSIDSIDSIIESNESLSLFSSKKIIIVKNIIELYSTKMEKKMELLLEDLEKDTTNVIILTNDTLDERKKLTKRLKKSFETFTYSKLEEKDIIVFVNNKIKTLNYTMNNQVIMYFLNKTGDDLYIIENELNKLCLYDKAEITKDMIDEVVSTYKSVDVFDLVTAIVSGDKIKAINLINELFDSNVEVLGIISLIANQIRLMYQVKILKEMNYSQKDMATFLEIHPFRVKKALESDYLYTKKKLLNMLRELAKLDIDIKSIETDSKTRLELFIIRSVGGL